MVLAKAKFFWFDAQGVASARECVPNFQQLFGAHRMKPQFVEESEQPGRPGREFRGGAECIPHLQCASDELISPRTLHAVHAKISATDAHGIFRRPGARRIILRCHQAMARVHWSGCRGGPIAVAQAEYEIASAEHNAVNISN